MRTKSYARLQKAANVEANGPPEHLDPDGRGGHLLLGDVHLEEPLQVGVAEDLGVGRVRHLAAERDDHGVGAAQRHSASPYALRVATFEPIS